jgi:hypothetical protein
MFGIHPDLRRFVAATFLSTAALGLVGLTLLVAAAGGVPAFRAVPTWVTVVVAMVFLAVAYLGTVVAPGGYRAASDVVSSVRPIPGSVVLRLESSSDSTALYGRLDALESERVVQRRELPLLLPRWDVAPLLRAPAPVTVYLDPQTSDIVAFRTASGLLWCIPRRLRSA